MLGLRRKYLIVFSSSRKRGEAAGLLGEKDQE